MPKDRDAMLIERVMFLQPGDLSGSLLEADFIMDMFTRETLLVHERVPVAQNAEESALFSLVFTSKYNNPSD